MPLNVPQRISKQNLCQSYKWVHLIWAFRRYRWCWTYTRNPTSLPFPLQMHRILTPRHRRKARIVATEEHLSIHTCVTVYNLYKTAEAEHCNWFFLKLIGPLGALTTRKCPPGPSVTFAPESPFSDLYFWNWMGLLNPLLPELICNCIKQMCFCVQADAKLSIACLSKAHTTP